MTVAALYVDERGPYVGIDGVDVWGKSRDARLYAGPHPVVAHPPCARWGSYAKGGPSAPGKYRVGDDGGCFAAALASVRQFGGVIEHPAYSKAWAAYGLLTPNVAGGWTVADWFGGWTCRVDQSHYGHAARKGTWLYARSLWLPSLPWERREGIAKLEDGFHSAEERRVKKAARGVVERLSHRQRRLTPEPFRDLLLAIARAAPR